jgi:hypothetical protein
MYLIAVPSMEVPSNQSAQTVQRQTNGKARPSRARHVTPPTNMGLVGGVTYHPPPSPTATGPGRYIHGTSWALQTYQIPDDEDRDGS